jgi:hypothetical protein
LLGDFRIPQRGLFAVAEVDFVFPVELLAFHH